MKIGMRKNRKWTFSNIISYLGSIFRISILPIIAGNPAKLLLETNIANLNLPVFAYQIIIFLAAATFETTLVNRIFYFLSFCTVGIFYRENSCKPYGSILYTLFYTLYTFAAVIIIKYPSFDVFALLTTLHWAIISIIYLISAKAHCLPDDVLRKVIGYILFNLPFIITLIIDRDLCPIGTFDFILLILLASTVCFLNILNTFRLSKRQKLRQNKFRTYRY